MKNKTIKNLIMRMEVLSRDLCKISCDIDDDIHLKCDLPYGFNKDIDDLCTRINKIAHKLKAYQIEYENAQKRTKSK